MQKQFLNLRSPLHKNKKQTATDHDDTEGQYHLGSALSECRLCNSATNADSVDRLLLALHVMMTVMASSSMIMDTKMAITSHSIYVLPYHYLRRLHGVVMQITPPFSIWSCNHQHIVILRAAATTTIVAKKFQAAYLIVSHTSLTRYTTKGDATDTAMIHMIAS